MSTAKSRAQATLILVSLLLAGQEGATTAPREKSSGAQQQHVYVVERQLLPVHEHIIVGLPGLWAVTSPDLCSTAGALLPQGEDTALHERMQLLCNSCSPVVLRSCMPGLDAPCDAQPFCTVGGTFQLSS